MAPKTQISKNANICHRRSKASVIQPVATVTMVMRLPSVLASRSYLDRFCNDTQFRIIELGSKSGMLTLYRATPAKLKIQSPRHELALQSRHLRLYDL